MSLKPLPSQARPLPAKLLNQIFEFCELMQMSPGSAADIGAVYNLTRIDNLNSVTEKEITKRLYELSLKIYGAVDKKLRSILSKPPENLSDSLNARKKWLPSLSKLLSKICHLVDITGLELPSFNELSRTFDKYYPYLERSREDRASWNIFMHFHHGRYLNKNESIMSFLKEADSAQDWRNRVQHVTLKINQSKSIRTEEITDPSLFRNGTWQLQAKHLQLLLNSLVCEEK